MTILKTALVAALALSLAAEAGAAKQLPGSELTQVLVSREQLELLATRLEQTANSGSFTSDVRARNRAQAALVRQRLADGDFQPGDRISLTVQSETSLTDTFTVRAGRELQLPSIGVVPLQGVLRVELSDHITRFLSQYVRNPQVRAQALIRIAVIGDVGRQGFFMVPVDIPVNDVLMVAGGIGGLADIDKMRIERGTEVLYDGTLLQEAITQGRTLDALSIQAGDRFVIPTKRTARNPFQSVQTIQVLLTIPLTIFGLVRLFK